LGYPLDTCAGGVPATEFLARARAWQAFHDPYAVRDPEAAGDICWTPDSAATEAYQRGPAAYRTAFAAFTMVARPPGPTDWISWRIR
jgi:hypothetical protein